MRIILNKVSSHTDCFAMDDVILRALPTDSFFGIKFGALIILGVTEPEPKFYNNELPLSN